MPQSRPARDIPYTVRRSTRARRVRVNVHAHTGVEVVLPQRAPERAAAAAVSELRPWIERRLREAREARASIAARAGTVAELGAARAAAPPAGGAGGPAVERFDRRAARTEIAERLDRATARAGHAYSGLDIRGQRTRWASCS